MTSTRLSRSGRPAGSRLAAPALAAVLVLATGCSGDEEPAGTPEPAAGTASTSPTSAAPSPSPSPTPTEPTPTEEPTPSEPPAGEEAPPADTGPAGLEEALLPAAQFPWFNDGFSWREGRTRDREPAALAGTCHRFPLESVGATAVRHRTYVPPAAGSDAVGQMLVAEFPDPETASRAYRTVLSWRASCPELLESYPRADVRLLEDVGVPRGEAGWWIALYAPVGDDPEVSAFDAEGVALVGDRIAVVHLVSYGQDYNYDTGQEPAAVAIRRAAPLL